MKIASLAIALLFAICLAVASACGGGDGESELERALRTVTENDLAIMVLPQEDLGQEFADLEIDDESGFTDNEEAADDTVDPDDTADDLEQAGRINGYELGYETSDFSVLEEGEGVFSVGTDVDLFRDAEVASDFVDKQIDDYLRLEGEEIEAGLTLEKVEMFGVSGLADEAVGVKARALFGDVEIYMTFVGFRLDRLLGAASVVRVDDADVNSQVEAIARALEERVEGVLLGDIGGMPVAVPQAEEEATVAPPPEGGPDLAAMALTLDDLPAGASIDQEGYVEDEDTVASYEREFDPGSERIGTSEALYLRSEIDIYEDASQASLEFSAYEFLAGSESTPDFLASYLAATAGFEPTNVRLESLPTPGLEDESLAFSVSFDSPLGRLEMTFIFVRLDRVIGTLSLMGPAGDIDYADAVSLAEAMAARIAAEL